MNGCDVEKDTCPYDKSHMIVKSRMLTHLARCSKNFPDAEKQPCIFNNKHVVPVPEMRYHLEQCPDRFKGDTYRIKVGDVHCPVKEEVPIIVPLPEPDENWDDEPVTESVLSKIKERIETVGESDNQDIILYNGVIGKSKAARKQFRRKQILRVLNLSEGQSNQTPHNTDHYATDESHVARLNKMSISDASVKKPLSLIDQPVRQPHASTTSVAMKLQKNRKLKEGSSSVISSNSKLESSMVSIKSNASDISEVPSVPKSSTRSIASYLAERHRGGTNSSQSNKPTVEVNKTGVTNGNTIERTSSHVENRGRGRIPVPNMATPPIFSPVRTPSESCNSTRVHSPVGSDCSFVPTGNSSLYGSYNDPFSTDENGFLIMPIPGKGRGKIIQH